VISSRLAGAGHSRNRSLKELPIEVIVEPAVRLPEGSSGWRLRSPPSRRRLLTARSAHPSAPRRRELGLGDERHPRRPAQARAQLEDRHPARAPCAKRPRGQRWEPACAARPTCTHSATRTSTCADSPRTRSRIEGRAPRRRRARAGAAQAQGRRPLRALGVLRGPRWCAAGRSRCATNPRTARQSRRTALVRSPCARSSACATRTVAEALKLLQATAESCAPAATLEPPRGLTHSHSRPIGAERERQRSGRQGVTQKPGNVWRATRASDGCSLPAHHRYAGPCIREEEQTPGSGAAPQRGAAALALTATGRRHHTEAGLTRLQQGIDISSHTSKAVASIDSKTVDVV